MEADPTQPPNPTTESTTGEPPNQPPKKRGNPRTLNKGVPKNVARGKDGKLRSKGKAEKQERVLSNETQSILDAMRHVHHNGPPADRTYQQEHLRRWMLRNEAQFHDRLLGLEAEAAKEKVTTEVLAAPKWDGLGPCPTCRHEPEVEDTSTTAIRAMIGRVLDHAKAADIPPSSRSGSRVPELE